MFRTMTAAGLLALAGGSAASAACLPFQRGDGGSPVIRAVVEGQGPFSFILDTAASGTTLDDRRVAALKLTRDAATEQAEGLGGPLDVKLYKVRAFKAGPLSLTDFTAPNIPAPEFASHDVAGLAGIDVFGSSLTVWRAGARCVGIEASGHSPPGRGWRRVEADWLRPWKVMLPIRIGGATGWALLDTGAQYTVLNPAFATAAGLTDAAMTDGGSMSGIDGRPLTLKRGRVGPTTVGAWRWKSPTVRVAALPVFARLGAPDAPLAILGMDWLAGRDFAVDYGAKAVWQTPR